MSESMTSPVDTSAGNSTTDQGHLASSAAAARHTAARDGANSADNVLARIMFSESSVITTVSSYRARMQAFLDDIEPQLPTNNNRVNHN